jgi:hypothetical protein
VTIALVLVIATFLTRSYIYINLLASKPKVTVYLNSPDFVFKKHKIETYCVMAPSVAQEEVAAFPIQVKNAFDEKTHQEVSMA